jgi:GH25 family lysozyme M1 (1,4-beta-N-acetylmuramidase)
MKFDVNASALLLAAFAICASSSAFCQDTDDDEINPAALRPFWLGATGPLPAAPPYVLTAGERNSYQGTFGIDLSHYSVDTGNSDRKCRTQDGYADPACSCSIGWQTLADNQILYTYTKATDGAGVDLSFQKIWSELKPLQAAGKLYRGAYHFLRPDVDAATQANTFLKATGVAGSNKPAQLSPVLDIEWSSKQINPGTNEFNACPVKRRTQNDKGTYYCDMWYKLDASAIGELAKKWIDQVEAGTGLPVTVYTNPTGWWNAVMTPNEDPLLKGRAVWTSRYTSAGPQYDPRWTSEGGSPKWKMAPLPRGASYPTGSYNIPSFWQFSEAALLPANIFTCAGSSVRRAVDMNWIPVGHDQYPKLLSGAN